MLSSVAHNFVSQPATPAAKLFAEKLIKTNKRKNTAVVFKNLLYFIKNIIPKSAEIKIFGQDNLLNPEFSVTIKNWKNHGTLTFSGNEFSLRMQLRYFKKNTEGYRINVQQSEYGKKYTAIRGLKLTTDATPYLAVLSAVIEINAAEAELRIRQELHNSAVRLKKTAEPHLLKIDPTAYIDHSGQLNTYSYLNYEVKVFESSLILTYKNISITGTADDILQRLKWIAQISAKMKFSGICFVNFKPAHSRREIKKQMLKLKAAVSTGCFQMEIKFTYCGI